MRSCRSLLLAGGGVLLLLVIAAGACGGDGGSGDASAGSAADGPSPTPFSLGSTLTIRGQQVTLPPGVTFANLSSECQVEAAAARPECLRDFKVLTRGRSYIVFEPSTPRVIARRIEPEDESDFRPLLGLIAGTTSGESSTGPTPTR